MIAKLEQDSQSFDCKTRKTFKLFDVCTALKQNEKYISLAAEFHTLHIKLPVDLDSPNEKQRQQCKTT
jgi:hypothetical protein